MYLGLSEEEESSIRRPRGGVPPRRRDSKPKTQIKKKLGIVKVRKSGE